MADNTEMKPETLAIPRRRWLRPLIFGLIILCCGMVIGGAGVGWFVHARVMELIHTPEIVPQHLTDAMQRSLGLTQEQADEVLGIYNKYLDRFIERRRQMRPLVEKDLASLHDEITAALTPEQAEKWDGRFQKIKNIILPGT